MLGSARSVVSIALPMQTRGGVDDAASALRVKRWCEAAFRVGNDVASARWRDTRRRSRGYRRSRSVAGSLAGPGGGRRRGRSDRSRGGRRRVPPLRSVRTLYLALAMRGLWIERRRQVSGADRHPGVPERRQGQYHHAPRTRAPRRQLTRVMAARATPKSVTREGIGGCRGSRQRALLLRCVGVPLAVAVVMCRTRAAR